jgi:hypothetical protein
MAEPNTANDALVLERVHKIHVQNPGHRLVEDSPPILPNLLDVVRQTFRVEISKRIGVRRRRRGRVLLRHPRMVWRRVGRHLGGLARPAIRDRGVDLRCGRASCGRPADRSLVSRSRRRGALRGLGREAARCRPLRVLLLERRLLRRRGWGRRRTLQSGGRGRHMRGLLLLLLLRVRRRCQAALRDLSREDGPNDGIASRVADLRRRLRRSHVLRGRVHGTPRASATLQLAA